MVSFCKKNNQHCLLISAAMEKKSSMLYVSLPGLICKVCHGTSTVQKFLQIGCYSKLFMNMTSLFDTLDDNTVSMHSIGGYEDGRDNVLHAKIVGKYVINL